MAFIDTIAEQQAAGEVEQLYESVRKKYGCVPGWARVFSPRPEVMRAWGRLIATISDNLDERTYELATVAAALALRHSGCALAHGERLLGKYLSGDQLIALAQGDDANAGLSPADWALVRYAEAVVNGAHAIDQSDIDRLREHGFSDTQIFDVASVAAARCFFSKLLDALGTQPDADSGRSMAPAVRRALTVGRPIETTGENAHPR